jgi:hypothetical protein
LSRRDLLAGGAESPGALRRHLLHPGLDSDANENPTVARALRDCARAIESAGKKLYVETWQ